MILSIKQDAPHMCFLPMQAQNTERPSNAQPFPTSLFIASSNLILHSLIPLLPNLRLKVHVNKLQTISKRFPLIRHVSSTYLSLLRRPLPVSVAIKHNLRTSSISDFDCRVRKNTFGAPFQLVARVFCDEEGLCAADVLVGV